MTDTEIEGIPDGEYTVVVDAIEDDLATVFFEADGEEVGDALIDTSVLPAEARHADAIVSVTLTDGAVVEAAYEPEQTAERAERAQNRFDRLSERPPDDNS